MIAQLQQEPIPLQEDAEGTIRVGGTRVTLETVIAAFQSGATAEQIAEDYPSLSLADVYTVIGMYLRHRGEVENYLGRQRTEAEQIRARIESHPETQLIRQQLLARREARNSGHAPVGDG